MQSGGRAVGLWSSWAVGEGIGGLVLHDVEVEHRGFDAGMAEEFLDGADVDPVLKEVGGEGVAKDVGVGQSGGGAVGQSDRLTVGLSNRRTDFCLLQSFLPVFK